MRCSRLFSGGAAVLAIATRNNDDLYRIVMVLHILVAIVGFGGVMLNGLYGSQIKKHRGTDALAIAEANYKVSTVAEYFIYAVPVLGVLLVLLSDHQIEFSDLWVGLSIAIYVVAIGVSHAVMLPTVRRILVLLRELAAGGPPPAGAAAGPPPQVLELQALGQRAGATGATLNVMLVAVLVLMVFQPH